MSVLPRLLIICQPCLCLVEYRVLNNYSYANFAQSESSDGENVAGSYTIKLPDGCTKIVTQQPYHSSPKRCATPPYFYLNLTLI